jgi:hypothetical protein
MTKGGAGGGTTGGGTGATGPASQRGGTGTFEGFGSFVLDNCFGFHPRPMRRRQDRRFGSLDYTPFAAQVSLDGSTKTPLGSAEKDSDGPQGC